MRVLHVVKTSDGSQWAARQAKALFARGVEVHVILPSEQGRAIPDWVESGAHLHFADLRLPVGSPWELPRLLRNARTIVSQISPDIIHSHFVTTTCLIRMALGPRHPVPRVYQVAGPLHLEHGLSRRFEISLAGPPDIWVCSSRYVMDLYRKADVPEGKLFLSYYGWFEENETRDCGKRSLREIVGAEANDILIGNANMMYAPKYHLGQRVGIKCHEDVIDALSQVISHNPRILGVLVGGAWGGAVWYEERLKRRAWRQASNRIRFTGFLPPEHARVLVGEFNLVTHVPISENCGGVIEPLNLGVPVIASEVGGIPEVIIDGMTGRLVPARDQKALVARIEDALSSMDAMILMAKRGRQLVRRMFDVERTNAEIFRIYEHLLDGTKATLDPFDSRAVTSRLGEEAALQ